MGSGRGRRGITCFLVFCFSWIGLDALGVRIEQHEIPIGLGVNERYNVFSSRETVGEVVVPVSFNSELPSGTYEFRIRFPFGEKGELKDGISTLNFMLPLDEMERRSINEIDYFIIPIEYEEDEYVVKEVPIYLTLPSEQLLPPGTYQGSLSCEIWSNGQLFLTESIAISAQIEEQIEAMISESSDDPFRPTTFSLIKFGEIDEKTEKDAYFTIRANQIFDVSIESINGGRMKFQPEDSKSLVEHFFPYKLQFDGEDIDFLSTTAHLTRYQLDHAVPFVQARMKFIMDPNPKTNFAGQYKDQILITISSTK